KNGRNWAIFSLEDLTGSMEVLAFAKTFEKCGSCVCEDAKLLVTGRLSADNRGGGRGGGEEEGEDGIRFKMMADDIEVIDDAQAQNAAAVRAARPPAQESAPEENGEMPSAVKGHVLLDKLASNGNVNGHSNGNGHTNGHKNGNGTNGHSNGNGFSFSRSSAPTVTLPPSNAPAVATPTFDDEGPARIGYGFAPPAEASDAVHVHVPAGAATREIVNRLYNVCRRHPGATQLWLHVDNGEEMVQLKVSASYWVNADDGFCQDVASLLGGENVLVPQG
ncbi:MAG: hypothetical protein KY445_11085, partial [Armatimonadetes bacterium]|nr:hypothetical protein [Armatimonadota bacterium]